MVGVYTVQCTVHCKNASVMVKTVTEITVYVKLRNKNRKEDDDFVFSHWKLPHTAKICTVPKIRNKYSQKTNCDATISVTIFMFQWAIVYISTIGLPILLQKNRWTDHGIL